MTEPAITLINPDFRDNKYQFYKQFPHYKAQQNEEHAKV